MNLTPAGRYVVACMVLAALLFVIGVAGRVATGQWGAEGVVGIVGLAGFVAFLMSRPWRWEA